MGINFLHIAMMMMMMSEGRRKVASMEEGSKEGNMHIPDSAMNDKEG